MAISVLCCPRTVGDSLDRAGAGFDLALQPASPCSHPSSTKDTSSSGQVPAVLCGRAEIKALCHFTGLCEGSQAIPGALKWKCLKCFQTLSAAVVLLRKCLSLSHLKGSDSLSVCSLNAPLCRGIAAASECKSPFSCCFPGSGRWTSSS